MEKSALSLRASMLGEHNKSQLYYRHSVEMLAKSLPSLPQPSDANDSKKPDSKQKESKTIKKSA